MSMSLFFGQKGIDRFLGSRCRKGGEDDDSSLLWLLKVNSVFLLSIQVYDALGISKLVEAALQGYHVTILAYGQTGSGKTFTINGPPQSTPRHPDQPELHQDAGIVQRALTDAFHQIREQRIASGEVLQVRNEVTAVEIYQENAVDLLSSRDTNLDVRFSKGNKFHVEGLTRRIVETPREAEICHLEAIHR